MRISDWSADVCSSDLASTTHGRALRPSGGPQCGGIIWIWRNRPRMAHAINEMSDFRPSMTNIVTAHSSPKLAPPGAFSTLNERSEEHTSELQSLMSISDAVFCLKKKIETQKQV